MLFACLVTVTVPVDRLSYTPTPFTPLANAPSVYRLCPTQPPPDNVHPENVLPVLVGAANALSEPKICVYV